MTFAAPTPDLRPFPAIWPRPTSTPCTATARSLPPPPPHAVSSPGPAPRRWRGDVGRSAVGSPLPMDAVVGREVADSFELIWPTGEIDEQDLGGPPWELSPPQVLFDDTPRPIVAGRVSEPMTVRLRPLTAPSEVFEPAPEPVSVDVVLAIQRAIAAIGADAVVEAALIDRPPTGARLAYSATGPNLADATGPADRAHPEDRITLGPPSDATDERRSALKRLIGGLRRR